MRLKVADNPAVSAPFIYTDQHTSLLRLNNQVIFIFSDYISGFICIILINYLCF